MLVSVFLAFGSIPVPLMNCNVLEKISIALTNIHSFDSISTTLTNLNEKERIEQQELDIKCLQLLRAILHNEIVKLPEDFEGDVKACKK